MLVIIKPKEKMEVTQAHSILRVLIKKDIHKFNWSMVMVDSPVPVHPGVSLYYMEIKFWD